MDIIEVTDNKKQYLDLLLLADEQEDMIDRYLERGRMRCIAYRYGVFAKAAVIYIIRKRR